MKHVPEDRNINRRAAMTLLETVDAETSCQVFKLQPETPALSTYKCEQRHLKQNNGPLTLETSPKQFTNVLS